MNFLSPLISVVVNRMKFRAFVLSRVKWMFLRVFIVFLVLFFSQFKAHIWWCGCICKMLSYNTPNQDVFKMSHPDMYSNLFAESENAHRFSVSSLLQLEVKCKKRNSNKSGNGEFWELRQSWFWSTNFKSLL